jgi:hypothetical protein
METLTDRELVEIEGGSWADFEEALLMSASFFWGCL